MKKFIALLLLVLPNLASACSFELSQAIPLLPLFVQLSFVVLIAKKLFDQFKTKESIADLTKYLVPLLLFYSVYSFVTTFLGGAICESYGKHAFEETLKFNGFLLSVLGLVMLILQSRSGDQKVKEKIVIAVALGVLLFIVTQLSVEYILPDSMFSQGLIIPAPSSFVVPTT